jgi:DNA-binding CsgD family transcriptional regulator
MTNKEIGARMGITERGVKHHVSRLFVLYGVTNRAELIARVLGRKRQHTWIAAAENQSRSHA